MTFVLSAVYSLVRCMDISRSREIRFGCYNHVLLKSEGPTDLAASKRSTLTVAEMMD
jgi:hypothetical protein